LIGSNKSGDPESSMEGYVSIRGEPTWLRAFMGGIEAQVDQADGRIMSQTTNTEDLTRAIVDTEARLRAQTALRDRLQQLLRSRPGRLADLLEVERELARVQGEIDAVQSNLAVMRTRVAMSELTINYRSAPRPVGSDTFRPLRDALANFLGIVVAGFAAIITIIAGLIPIAVVVVPIVWLILRWRKRRGGRIFGRKEKTPEASGPPSTSSG
jgi:chromosome segregation ATPase